MSYLICLRKHSPFDVWSELILWTNKYIRLGNNWLFIIISHFVHLFFIKKEQKNYFVQHTRQTLISNSLQTKAKWYNIFVKYRISYSFSLSKNKRKINWNFKLKKFPKIRTSKALSMNAALIKLNWRIAFQSGWY